MNPIALILKVISNLSQIKTDIGDFQRAGEDLFKGDLQRAEVEACLKDLCGILSSGLISIPGIDSKVILAAVSEGEKTVDAVIAMVKDIGDEGIDAVVPDVKAVLEHVKGLVASGVVSNFGGHTKEQVNDMLDGIMSQLGSDQAKAV